MLRFVISVLLCGICEGAAISRGYYAVNSTLYKTAAQTEVIFGDYLVNMNEVYGVYNSNIDKTSDRPG